MLSNKLYIGIAAIIIFVAGAGYVVYAGRPVMQLSPSEKVSQEQPTPAATTTPTTGSYVMTDVQTHNTQSDCWSAIGGDVYDLTSWVSRHPGGEKRIVGLCGNDGTAAFTGKHGNAPRPKAMLVLLKIGALK